MVEHDPADDLQLLAEEWMRFDAEGVALEGRNGSDPTPIPTPATLCPPTRAQNLHP